MKTLQDVSFSVLDLSPVQEGKTIADAFKNSLDLAQHTEKWGFKRFWMAEHHSMDGIGSSATAVILGYIAQGTKTIRVGSGGVMLPNHPPLIIAEQFGTLETLYPGRVDLGLGRAPGTDQATMRAIRRNHLNQENFPEQVQELLHYLGPVQEGQLVKAVPGAGTNVPIWLLGSSLFSAQLAASLGLPFAFAGHFAPAQMIEAIRIYKMKFTPSEHLQKPHVMVGVQVIAADTDERAIFLATSMQQQFINLTRNRPLKLQPPIENAERIWSPMEWEIAQERLETSIVGSPKTVAKNMQYLIDQTGADEVIITSHIYDHSERLRSYEIAAQVAGMI